MFGNFTPEERKAIAAKGHATRQRNLILWATKQQIMLDSVGLLEAEIALLEQQLADLRQEQAITCVAAKLTGKSLLCEEEIVAAALPWEKATGVYFLIRAGRIVYVGQSTHIFTRINDHVRRGFDSYAYVPCAPEMLDKLESLYIHVLRPPWNGELPDGSKHAPLPLDVLLGNAQYTGRRNFTS